MGQIARAVRAREAIKEGAARSMNRCAGARGRRMSKGRAFCFGFFGRDTPMNALLAGPRPVVVK